MFTFVLYTTKKGIPSVWLGPNFSPPDGGAATRLVPLPLNNLWPNKKSIVPGILPRNTAWQRVLSAMILIHRSC
jgi:hypothetical protein